MHLRAGLLTAFMLLPGAGPARAAHDPLSHAQGLWSGTAAQGGDKYEVTVSLKRVNRTFVGAGKGKAYSGRAFAGRFEAEYSEDGYAASVSAGPSELVMFTFDVEAVIAGGMELRLSSRLGGGTLTFKDDFTRCELVFGGGPGAVRATLRRIHPPPAAPKPAAGKAKKAPPPIPPFIMVR